MKLSSNQLIKIHSKMKFITKKFKIFHRQVSSFFTDPDFDSEHAFSFMEFGFKLLSKLSRHSENRFS